MIEPPNFSSGGEKTDWSYFMLCNGKSVLLTRTAKTLGSFQEVSEGIAKPNLTDPLTTAVATPTTLPLASRSVPPEFPGFMGA
jgi:hypothetical protein